MENKMNKINIELLKEFIKDSHKNCNYCKLKDTICVGENCSEEIFKSLLVENDSELKNVRESVKNNPGYSILYIRNDLNNDEKAYCIRQSPRYALIYMFDTMSEEEKELCIKEEPLLTYRWYKNNLTAKQRKLCEKLLK